MFHNYLITALRNFTRHKLYSFINIAGLTVGLTCAIFIILFVRDELSYDKWIPGTENLYRVEGIYHLPGQAPFEAANSPFPTPDAMAAEIPEVKAAVHLEPRRMTVALGERQFLEHVDVVSSNFFQVIQLPLIAGDRASLFRQPESAVITESAARKYFGTTAAMGKTLLVGGVCEFGSDVPGCRIRQASVVVTGIMKDLPHNTQLMGDVFIPNTSAADPMAQKIREDWLSSTGYGYVELQPGADPGVVTQKLARLIDRAIDPKKIANIDVKGSQIWHALLTPFREAHLSTDRYGGMTPAGSWAMVYGFAAIGVLILLVACFNFTNLATARATVRAREISLRKVMGAGRGQLIVQFLGESVLTAMFALLLALALTEVLLPLFDRMVGKPIAVHYLGDWPVTLLLLGTALAAGLIGGLYPALVLSRFLPASVLRANTSKSSSSGIIRTSLVVAQFAVSIGLGIVALVVFQQISFSRSLDLGLDKDGMVIVNASGMAPNTRESFVRALNAEPAIEGAALSGDTPFSRSKSNGVLGIPGQQSNTVIGRVSTGPGFFDLYRIRLEAGRALSDAHGADIAHYRQPHNVMVNQAFVRRFGFSPQHIIGKVLLREEDRYGKVWTQVTIVGVTADFKFNGDMADVEPAFYEDNPQDTNWVTIRVPANGVSQALSAIDRTWHQFAPSVAINRHFMNEDFELQFASEEKQEKIFALFVGIAIFIAAMGLFGLAAFSTERRTKEIGVRKVFGARTRDIVLLLLWQFSIPVLTANLVAWPVAYYYLRTWLEGYAYRISLNPLYFVGAGLAALLIAWITVIAHAAHVAKAHPVRALRYE